MTSFVLVKLWSKISAKSEIVQNTEKMTVFKGFKPKKRLIFGTDVHNDTLANPHEIKVFGSRRIYFTEKI